MDEPGRGGGCREGGGQRTDGECFEQWWRAPLIESPPPPPFPSSPDSINRNSRHSSPSPSLRFPTFQIKPPPLPRLSQLLR
ncbi:unnamed protein product [Musa hybrid cultivar]